MASFQLLIIHSENRVHIWEIFPGGWLTIMSSFLTLTKLVVHEGVVSSTFTTTHFSYTWIPNGVIKVITMPDNSFISSSFSLLDTYIATSAHRWFNFKTVKESHLWHSQCMWSAKVLKLIFTQKISFIYGIKWYPVT